MQSKKLVWSTIIAISLSTLLISPVNAEPTDIERQRTEVQNDIAEVDQEITAAEEEIIELDTQIEQNEEAIKENESMIQTATETITESQEEIEVVNEEIEILEEKIEKRDEILKQRAVSYQRNGGSVSYLEVIMGSKNFGDFIDRVALVAKIAQADSDLLAEHEADNQLLEDKKQSIENKIKDLNDQKVELEGMQALITEQAEHNEKLKAELEQKLEDNQELKQVLEQKDRILAARERAAREAERAAVASTQQPQTNSANEIKTLSSDENSPKPSFSPSSGGSGTIQAVLDAGKPYLGVPYRWAGRSPSTGFDCSGFIHWAFSQVGVYASPATASLQSQGRKVSVSEMKPGDLVFFDTYKKNGHVGIYVGGGKFIGSQNSKGLSYADMNNSYWGPRFKGHVRRIIE